MTQPRFCSRCRNPLATDAPAGLCPNCLFQLALELMGGGYLIMMTSFFILRLRPQFKRLPVSLFLKIAASIMVTGMILANVLPGVFLWLDYSTPAYIERLLYVVLGGFLSYLIIVKAFNRLSLMKKKQS